MVGLEATMVPVNIKCCLNTVNTPSAAIYKKTNKEQLNLIQFIVAVKSLLKLSKEEKHIMSVDL